LKCTSQVTISSEFNAEETEKFQTLANNIKSNLESLITNIDAGKLTTEQTASAKKNFKLEEINTEDLINIRQRA